MIKSVFENNYSFNFEKAKRLCDKYDVISFDIFDTLIKRNVNHSNDIFKLMNESAEKLKIKNFSNHRVTIAREIFKNDSYATLDYIYSKLENKYKQNLEFLKKLEMQYEEMYCQVNYDVKRLYEYCKSANKKIIAISDMYLPKELIFKILKNAGYNIDNIFVSCECKNKKTDGTLFKYAMKKEKLKSNQLIHIGDNFKADILGAKLAGVKAIHIKQKNNFNTKKYYNKISDKSNYEQYVNLINNNILRIDNYYKKFGFAILGPLMYNYCYWLRENCKKDGIDRIYFFSRDGHSIMKAFNSLFGEEIITHYLYVSRRSIRIPFITKHFEYEDILKMFPESKSLTMKIFFENLGLESEKYISLIKQFDMDLNDRIYYKKLFTDEKYKKIYYQIKEDVLNNAKKELNNLKKYFKQEKFCGKVAVVDVGWHNSMQYYIEQLFGNEKLDMHGYYVGFQKKLKTVKFSKAYISDYIDNIYSDSSLGFIGLIESVFLAFEGSTRSYSNYENLIIPELLNYEYNKNDIEYYAFSEIQEGMQEFINIVKNLKSFEIFRLSGYDAYLPFKSYGINPYYKDILKFQDFRYFSEEIVYFAKTKPILQYIKNPKLFLEDFYKSRWKIGFVKKILKIKLPYYFIYKKMKGIKK